MADYLHLIRDKENGSVHTVFISPSKLSLNKYYCEINVSITKICLLGVADALTSIPNITV